MGGERLRKPAVSRKTILRFKLMSARPDGTERREVCAQWRD